VCDEEVVTGVRGAEYLVLRRKGKDHSEEIGIDRILLKWKFSRL
jgi:hypothetical protein